MQTKMKKKEKGMRRDEKEKTVKRNRSGKKHKRNITRGTSAYRVLFPCESVTTWVPGIGK